MNAAPVGYPALTVFKMGPRDTRDSTETNGNVHLTEKDKGKAKISRASSNVSLGDPTSEAVDTGIAAVRQITKILRFVQNYDEEIDDVEGIYGLGIRQQARTDELEITVINLAFRNDQEMARLQDKNDTYQANVRQLRSRERSLNVNEQVWMTRVRQCNQR